jgi:hypothetical protein
MYKAKWNGTEDITYRIVTVEIQASRTKTNWQNAFVGTKRQAIECKYQNKDKEFHTFYLDNEDGSGLSKVLGGGSPREYHASIDNPVVLEEIPKDKAILFDKELHDKFKKEVDTFIETNFPEEWKMIQYLRNFKPSTLK